jgi:hypothetical protein
VVWDPKLKLPPQAAASRTHVQDASPVLLTPAKPLDTPPPISKFWERFQNQTGANQDNTYEDFVCVEAGWLPVGSIMNKRFGKGLVKKYAFCIAT